MEDQFGGRTDDDLFYDDVEPVAVDTNPLPPEVPTPSPPSAALSTSTPSQETPTEKPSGGESAVVSTSSQPPPGKSLASSRWAGPPTDPPRHAPAPPPGPGPSPRDKKRQPAQKSAAKAGSRLGSGANPRQKLTEEELAAKMERMKLLAAEKTRKFEMAEKDQQQHAEAYARGMEEARKRRAQEAERRRRLDDEKRKLDQERARNRERKLKAMGLKDGGWDQGKEAMAEDPSSSAPFRSAHGGVRGSRGGPRPGRELDVGRFLNDRRSTPGARPGPGRQPVEEKSQAGATAAAPTAPALTADQFPALPTEAVKAAPEKVESPAETLAPKPLAADLVAPVPAPPTPPAGPQWDDEMAALDAAGSGPA